MRAWRAASLAASCGGFCCLFVDDGGIVRLVLATHV